MAGSAVAGLWGAFLLSTNRFEDDGDALLLIVGLPEPWIVFLLWLLGGPAAIAALLLLVPPLVRLAKAAWARWTLG
jgi:hypothetical protein